MAQASRAHGWYLDVERGPECLFVHPRRTPDEPADAMSLAQQVWSLLEQNFTHRVVLELSDIGALDELLLEQILDLNNRVRACGGMMRLCGLSARNRKVLADEGLDGHVASYADREAAVMGWARPQQPR
jgi:anti-anti-sigma regulatory factor